MHKSISLARRFGHTVRKKKPRKRKPKVREAGHPSKRSAEHTLQELKELRAMERLEHKRRSNSGMYTAGRRKSKAWGTLTQLLTHSLTHSLVHSHTRSLTRSLAHSLTHSLTNPLKL